MCHWQLMCHPKLKAVTCKERGWTATSDSVGVGVSDSEGDGGWW